MSERDGSNRYASSSSDVEAPAAQVTGYQFTDDPWIRWRNTWRYLTGGLTEEGIKQYQKGRDDRMEESDCKRCEQDRDYALQYSTILSLLRPRHHLTTIGPIIRFLNQKISALGGDLHSGNIVCVRCHEDRGGGLDPVYGIQLCANRGEPVEDTLAHGQPDHPVGLLFD